MLLACAAVPAIHAADETYETAALGTRVTFSVTSDGFPAPKFQWLKDGAAITGATNATLVLPSVSYADKAVYNAVATNSHGWALSNDLILTVVASLPTAPTFTLQPYPSATVPAGTSFTLNATAVGDPAPTYQWFKNGKPVAGATGSFLNFPIIGSSDSGAYTVTATNSAGSATSNTSYVKVVQQQGSSPAPAPAPTAPTEPAPAPAPVEEPAPAPAPAPETSTVPYFSTQPVSTWVPQYYSVTFSATAIGTPEPTYQWYKDGAAIPGATDSSFSIKSASYASAGTYTVVATNSAGSTTSAPALLSVK